MVYLFYTNLIKRVINKNVRRVRRYSTAMEQPVSVRQKAWQAAQRRYENYEHVQYSSFLECQLIAPTSKTKTQTKPFPPLERLQRLPVNTQPTYPNNWMEDYEFYEGAIDESGNINSKHGTADPTVPPSQVPCNGCGAHLHCANAAMPGYIPSEIFKGRSTPELQTINCQRCHFLKHYSIALDVEVPPSAYVDTISNIKDKYALAIVVVDLLDFPSCIWPGMQQVVGSKRPIFIVGNKVDLLPRDSNNYLTHIKSCLQQQFIEHGGFNALNIKNISLISAKTGYGIEELITQLQKIWLYKGDVYLLGCTNVGKSTLFNILLNSDYCRPEASKLLHKATSCPWPGTTLHLLKFPIQRPSEIRIYQRFKRILSTRAQKAALDKLRRDQALQTGSVEAAQLIGNVGQTYEQRADLVDAFSLASGTQPINTLDEKRPDYREARWVYDTPGVMQPDQLTPLLTTEELLQLQVNEMIRPRAYRVKPHMSLLVAGLARLDLISCRSDKADLDWLKLFVFASPNLPVLITNTEHAEAAYKRYLGTPLLGIPISNNDGSRLLQWPGLQCRDENIVVQSESRDVRNAKNIRSERKLTCDITLSSAGWLGLLLPENSECTVRVWTPNACGIYLRKPPLIPLAERLVGKHIRNSLAYNISRPFVFKK